MNNSRRLSFLLPGALLVPAGIAAVVAFSVVGRTITPNLHALAGHEPDGVRPGRFSLGQCAQSPFGTVPNIIALGEMNNPLAC